MYVFLNGVMMMLIESEVGNGKPNVSKRRNSNLEYVFIDFFYYIFYKINRKELSNHQLMRFLKTKI